jgi:hypothetical protein
MMEVRPLTHARFEALLYRKAPWTHVFSKELEWWTNESETLIAAVILDLVDHDYSWIILGRDETGVFRGIDLNTSLPSLEAARLEQKRRIEELSKDNPQEFPQGDNDRRKHEILMPCVAESRLHPNFKFLIENGNYSPARGLIKELSYAFRDLDGNYKKDFQTSGFEGRLWELFLYAAFYEEKFLIKDDHQVPDFLLQKQRHEVAVEAVTVNPTAGAVPQRPKNADEERILCENYMAIKWGSPLFSKLRKRYWEKEQIKGLPLVFAIHDFHDLGSMTWSLPALSDYLYGIRCGADGDDQPIDSHTFGGKTIPSGFFSLPGAEHVSAVIASNEATLTKFNRMGKIAGFGDLAIEMKRFGSILDLERFVEVPFKSVTEIGVETESWASGLWVFHNPRAIFPFHEDLLHSALNVILQDGQRYYFSSRRMHILRSFTTILGPAEKQ